VKVDARLDLPGLLGEGNAMAGAFLFEVRNGRDVLVDDRFTFGGLQL
jgi:hypothetical protein